MSKKANEFMFLFRGGVDPATLSPAQREKLMESWFTWMGRLRSRKQFTGGAPLADDAKVLSGKSGSKIANGTYGKGDDEVGGYLMVKAKDLKSAVKLAQGCPIFANHGTVEVRPVQRM